MIRQTLINASLSLLLVAGAAFSNSFELDKTHSSVSFKVAHMVISKVKGDFRDYTTEVNWDSKNLSKSVLNATIQTASINTNDEKRDEHLRSPDFFDAATNPTITFKSEKIVKKGKGFQVTGALTMRGVTKKVTIPFMVSGPITDPWGNTRLGLEGSFTVNRQDYGVNFSKAMDNGGLVVGNEVEIDINVEVMQPKAAQ